MLSFGLYSQSLSLTDRQGRQAARLFIATLRFKAGVAFFDTFFFFKCMLKPKN